MKSNIISSPKIARITQVEWDENPYYELMYLNNNDRVICKNFDTWNEVQKHLSKFKIAGHTKYTTS